MEIMTVEGWKQLTPRCTPAPHDKSLLESLGLSTESGFPKYKRAVRAYLAGEIDHKTMVAAISGNTY